MGLLFDQRYELSLEAFNLFLATHPHSTYREDVSFRRAVCAYGMSEYHKAETMLSDFIGHYPDSLLRGETTMMLGDVAANFGEQNKAVARFQEAIGHDLNIEFYNYCSFRCGEILDDSGQHPELVRHFRSYIERRREGSNVPMAIHYVVRGLWMQDDTEGALRYFLAAVRDYGADRQAVEVDVLLDEWVGLSRKPAPAAAATAWRDLATMMDAAGTRGQRSLELRLKRLLLYRQGGRGR